MIEAELERRAGSEEEVERCYAPDGFDHYCSHYITTEWEEAPGRTEQALYPSAEAFPFLQKYRDVYQHEPASACLKSRGMLASTDPLMWDFWNTQRISYHNRVHRAGIAPWRGGVQRQSETDSIALLKRVYEAYPKIPVWLRQPLDKTNDNLLSSEGGGIIRAFHAGATAGRGDGWDHMNIDEIAFQQRAEENWQAFDRVRLKQGTSTPNGRGNWFDKLCHGGVPGVVVVSLHYGEHPDRVPGTVAGDAWMERKKIGKTEAIWQIEYELAFDVYKENGYYTLDFKRASVAPVDWDGEGIITLGTDYSYVNPAALWSFVDEWGRWCRLGEQLRHNVKIDTFYGDLFDMLMARYPGHTLRIAPDPFRGKQHRSSGDTDISDIKKAAKKSYGRRVQVAYHRVEEIRHRPPMHNMVRSLWLIRDDLPASVGPRYGTVIDPSCELFIQGCEGAYGPKESASPHQVNDLEEPDDERDHVHIMDSDRYGLVQYMRTTAKAEFKSGQGEASPRGDKREKRTRRSFGKLQSRFGVEA